MIRKTLGWLVLASLCSIAVAADSPVPVPMGVRDYAAWVNQKVGATVTHDIEETNGDKTLKTHEVYTLKTVEADKLTVERSAERTDASGKTSTSQSISSLSPPKESPRSNPDSTIEQGDEQVMAGGKTYKCHFFKLTTKRDATTRVWTIWTSPEVPGGVVKQTTVQTNGDKTLTIMTDTLVDFKAGA